MPHPRNHPSELTRQGGRDRAETRKASFDVFDDLLREVLWFWQVIQIREAVVFQPEKVEAGFVACGEFGVSEFPPAAFRILFRMPRFTSQMTVVAIVAADKVLKVLKTQRLSLQRVMNVGPVVVIPNLLGRDLFACRTVVKEEHVRFHAIGVEDARRQAENRVKLRCLHELLPHRFTGAALEEHVVRQHHSGATRGLEHRADVLKEVKLLVARGGPEILAVVNEVLLLLLTFFVRESHRALFAEGRIGEDVVDVLRWRRNQRVGGGNIRLAVDFSNVVKEKIHQAQATRARHNFVAVEGVVFKEPLLLRGELVVLHQIIVGREEEAAGTASWIGDRFARLGSHASDHRLDERTRRKVLARARLCVLCVPFKNALVNVAFHIGIKRGPRDVVHHLDQTREFGGILDLVLRLGENLPEHALLGTQFTQCFDVVNLELRALERAHHGPRKARGHAHLPVVRRLRIFIRHLEEDEVGELLEIVAVAHTIVAQRVAEGPDFGNNTVGSHDEKLY